MKKVVNKKERGQLLIEAVVAMALVGIIITGIVTALTFSINNSMASKDQNLATFHAQEGIDVARNMKDADFAAFSVLNGTYNLPSGATTIASGNSNTPIDGKFTRQIIIDQGGTDDRSGVQRCTATTAIFVASIVSWSDNRCSGGANCHNTELNSCFADPADLLY